MEPKVTIKTRLGKRPRRFADRQAYGMLSSARRVLLLLLPPLVVDVVRYVRGMTVNESAVSAIADEPIAAETPLDSPLPPEWEAVPNSSAVWNHAGWSHESIVATQSSKWSSFVRSVQEPRPLGQSHEGRADAPADYATHNTIMTFGYALGRVARKQESVSLLDWGGGLGHYYVYARALFPDLVLDYVVKDLPGFCATGAALLPEVTFLSDEAKAIGRSYDFVFVSSSLHYARDHYGLLDSLCGCARHWLMITRTPFVEQTDDFVVVQRPHLYGYMTEYPGWFMNRARMLDFMSERGFDLIRQFLVAEQPNVPNAPEKAYYYGFLFQRIAPSNTQPFEDHRAER
jgi:putative methyltransferase (TIGR04325 family)